MRTKFEDYSEFMNIKDCPDCNGDGYNEYLNCSALSSSDCCGGCYEKRICRRCDGDKTVIDEDQLLFRIDAFKRNRFKREYDPKYWKLSCGLSIDKLQRIILPDRRLTMHYWYQIKKK